MAADASTRAVLLAVIGNAFLTALKFTAFAFSASGSMFSEAIHSLADTANQTLLFIGIRRSERAPNALFPYGFGGERYLFALLSAVGIFVLGCGVTIYHGIHLLRNPVELHVAWYVFAVLGVAFVVDGFVLSRAIAAIHEVRGHESFLGYLRGTSDPTVAAVLLEDGVACLGVLIAMGGIGLSVVLESPVPDAIATLIIGAMMGLIAIWLGLKNRSLIVGRAIPAPLQQQIVEYLLEQPTVQAVRNTASRVVGAGTYRFKAEVDWNGAVLAERQLGWVESAERDLSTAEQRATFTRELGERITDALGDEIDRIEHELRTRFPELKYLDFESD